MSAFGDLLLTDADQYSAVMAQHCHALLHHGAVKTFVTHLAGAARKQAGDMAFDDRTTRARGAGSLHLLRRALAIAVCLIAPVEGCFGPRVGRHGLHGFRHANREHLALMPRLTSDGIGEAQSARHGRHGPLGSTLDPCGGLLDFVAPRQDVAHLTRIALGRQVRKDKARGGF